MKTDSACFPKEHKQQEVAIDIQLLKILTPEEFSRTFLKEQKTEKPKLKLVQ